MHGPAVLFFGIFHLLLQWNGPTDTLDMNPRNRMVTSTVTGCYTAFINIYKPKVAAHSGGEKEKARLRQARLIHIGDENYD